MFDPVSLGLGALNFVGGLFSQSKTDDRLQAQMAFNSEQAQKQMDFQERMSNSAYQRAMADMKTAGLNPMLAFSRGGATTPSGAAGSGASSPAENIVAPATASAVAAARVKQELLNMQESNKNLQEQNVKLQAEQKQIGAQTINITADTAQKMEVLSRLKAEAERGREDEKFYQTPFGKDVRYIGNAVRELFGGSGVSSAVSSAVKLRPGPTAAPWR